MGTLLQNSLCSGDPASKFSVQWGPCLKTPCAVGTLPQNALCSGEPASKRPVQWGPCLKIPYAVGTLPQNSLCSGDPASKFPMQWGPCLKIPYAVGTLPQNSLCSGDPASKFPVQWGPCLKIPCAVGTLHQNSLRRDPVLAFTHLFVPDVEVILHLLPAVLEPLLLSEAVVAVQAVVVVFLGVVPGRGLLVVRADGRHGAETVGHGRRAIPEAKKKGVIISIFLVFIFTKTVMYNMIFHVDFCKL